MKNVFKKFLKNPTLTKTQLATLVVIYLYLLNSFSNQSIAEMLSAVWVMLLFWVILLIFSFLHRYVFKAFLILQIFITSLAVFAKQKYQITITEDILLSALISENDLTAEMISLPLMIWLFITAILPSVFVCWLKISPVKIFQQIIYKTALIIGAIASVFAIFFVQGYEFKKAGSIRDERFTQDLINFSPVDVLYNFNKAVKAKKRMAKTYANVQLMSQTYDYKTQVDDLLVVFVLGESSRGDHFAINGYAKNTTPKLAQIDNLISFKQVTSCDTLTINSVHCLSSPMLKSQENREIRQSSFGEVLKSVGYSTDIYALQTLTGFYQFLQYDKLITKYSVLNEQSVGAKDKALLPYVKQAISDYHGGKKLIIAHTLGSHQTYVDRFDKESAVFTPFCQNPDVANCSKDELINAYDNTIVAVDSFLADIIAHLQDKKALLIYVSDHGESLGENGHYFHGEPVATAPKEQFDIPFLFWFSDSYKNTAEGKQFFDTLQQKDKQNLQISHDHVFHSVLGCVGVVSDTGLDKDLNLCQ